MSQDATLRPHLDAWDAKYQDVINQVNLFQVPQSIGTDDEAGACSQDNPGERVGGDDDNNGGKFGTPTPPDVA